MEMSGGQPLAGCKSSLDGRSAPMNIYLGDFFNGAEYFRAGCTSLLRQQSYAEPHLGQRIWIGKTKIVEQRDML